ncbi:hypothetical protein GCM10010282_37670 [Streptomyces roseolus]|nr:hypothetical protein GCM10010282_37670 [Streptomyces roseolus]
MTARPDISHQAPPPPAAARQRTPFPRPPGRPGRSLPLLGGGRGAPVSQETGLVIADGLAASRGGRRSHRVRLTPGLRFLGADTGATSIDAGVTNVAWEV